MKQLCVLLVILAFAGAAGVSAQTSSPTRPRIVKPTPTPKTQKLPPFLGGAVNTEKQSAPQTSPNATASPVATPQTAPTLQTSRSTEKLPSASASPTPNASASVPTANQKDGEIAEDDEVIRIETNLVTIPVAVVDRNNRFIPGLQQADFQVFEDGKPQEIAYFANTEQPFTVVMLIDVSNSTRFKIEEIQDAALAFIRNLKENDRVMVIGFSEQVQVLTEPTTDRSRIARAVRSLQFGSGTSLYDAVDYVLNRRLESIEGRKAVVLFSDGVDTTSRFSDYEATISDSQESEAAFYSVLYNTYNDMQQPGSNYPSGGRRYPRQNRRPTFGDILGTILGGGTIDMGGNTGGGRGGRGTSREEYKRGAEYMQDLSTRSGGRFYQADTTQNLDTAFYNIAQELRQQYSVGYYPAEVGQKGQRKQIKVRVNRTGAVVRARDSYVVGEDQKQAPPRRTFSF
ncbi:MAG TPA: VWA domain-containing protein [Pyrinomonadaceae bacterium]|jgi:VWFA-related protein